MEKTLGIIGFGRFGQLTARYLKDYCEVSVYDCVDKRKEAEKLGVKLVSLKECASKDIIILCVPISALEGILKQISPLLKKGSFVFDVCSVKEEPVKIMKKWVPKECECIGTHPLFGPDTTNNGLKQKKIVLCPIKSKQVNKVKDFLEGLGLIVMVTTPKEHDRQMANSLDLIHLLGKLLHKIGVRKTELATPTHEMFMELMDIAKKDSEQLFIDMQTYNRFAPDVRKKMIKALIEIDGELDAKLGC